MRKHWTVNILIPIIFIVGLLFASQSCSDNVSTNIDNLVFPDSLVSFQNHVQPFLRFTCSFQGCHSDETRAGGRRLTDYFSLFDTENTGLIILFEPDKSVLVQMIERKIPHIPELYWDIKPNHSKGIRKWIKEGAKNN